MKEQGPARAIFRTFSYHLESNPQALGTEEARDHEHKKNARPEEISRRPPEKERGKHRKGNKGKLTKQSTPKV